MSRNEKVAWSWIQDLKDIGVCDVLCVVLTVVENIIAPRTIPSHQVFFGQI